MRADWMNWLDRKPQEPGEVVDGVIVERLACAAPALVWTPTEIAPPWPVVLLGHGNGGGKDEPYMQSVARRFSLGAGAAVVVIDGPIHGERSLGIGPGPEAQRERQQAFMTWMREGDLEGFVAEWRDALDAVARQDGVDGERVAYAGFSMGTLLGLPTVAGLGCEVRTAVFGLGGLLAGTVIGATTQTAIEGLPEVDILCVNAVDDELIPFDAAVALFRALPEPKRLLAYPGGHIGLPAEAISACVEFVAKRLLP